MSKTPLVLIAGLLAATFACAPGSAQPSAPGNASCSDARPGQAIGANVVSNDGCKAPKAIAFNVSPDRECAMLICKTYILTGVGD
jgi:hypothetical protein